MRQFAREMHIAHTQCSQLALHVRRQRAFRLKGAVPNSILLHYRARFIQLMSLDYLIFFFPKLKAQGMFDIV